MNLDYILEVMKTAQSRLGNGQMDYIEAIDEAIIELEKVIAENDKMKDIGTSGPDEEPLGSRMLLLNENEKVFWQEAYIHAMKISSRLVSAKIFPLLSSESIADNAIKDLRLRLEKNDE